MTPGREGVPPSRRAKRPSLRSFLRTILIALALCLPASLTLAQEPKEAEDTAVLQKFFTNIQNLSADFTQLELDADGLLRRESTGRLYLSRPGRFRLDYKEPDDVMLWADGERLWMYDRELEQVTVWQQSRQLKESAAALLAGDASVLENFDVETAEFEDGLQWFDLTGMDAQEGEMRLALRGSLPVVIEYADELGSTVRMFLRGLDLNGEMDDGLFAPEIPENVDIFEAAES